MFNFLFLALDLVLDLDLRFVNPEVHQDLSLVHADLDQNPKVLLAAVQGLDHVQEVDHILVVVLHQAVVLVQQVVLHAVGQDRILDQDLILLVVLNHVLNLVVNPSRCQGHQHIQNRAVFLLPTLQLIQVVGLHPIHQQDLDLVADLLPGPGKYIL